MDFKYPLLEIIFKQYKWERNNTIQLFNKAESENILDFVSSNTKQKKYTFQPVFFQFQCIVTTTDTYFRKITNHQNTDYAIFVQDDVILKKDKITQEVIKEELKDQMYKLQDLLKGFSDNDAESNICYIQTIIEHEYLH